MPRLSLRLLVLMGLFGGLVAAGTGALAARGGPAAAGIITVRPGDTLWGLAQRYHTSMDAIARANGLEVNGVLYAGRTLVLPGAVWTGSMQSASATAADPDADGDVDADPPGGSAAPAAAVSTPALAPQTFTMSQLVQMGGFCSASRALTGPTGGLPAALRQSPDRMALIPLFAMWSRAYGVPASLVEAVAWHESAWQNTAVSSANAQGIGQLMPGTASFVSQSLLGKSLNVNVASDNIQMTSRYLAYLLKWAGGNVCTATAAYFQGPGSVQQVGVLPASQAYVRSVLALRLQFS